MAYDSDALLAAVRHDPKVELRRAVLTDDLLALPPVVQHLERGLDDVRATLREMAGTLAQHQATMAGQQAMLAQQQATLAQLQDTMVGILRLQEQNTKDIAALVKAVGHLSDRVGWLEGWVLEERYRNRATPTSSASPRASTR